MKGKTRPRNIPLPHTRLPAHELVIMRLNRVCAALFVLAAAGHSCSRATASQIRHDDVEMLSDLLADCTIALSEARVEAERLRSNTEPQALPQATSAKAPSTGGRLKVRGDRL
jgi:hypothetical protein